MDCKQAEDLQLAVKYVLGELPPVQRDEYEDHYIDCPACAQDVYAAAAFTDTAREVFRQEGRGETSERARGGWLAAWLRPAYAVPAFALLLVAFGYQSLVAVPHLKNAAMQASAPRVLPMYSLIAANAKGPKAGVFQARAGEPLGLYVDVPVEPVYTHYAMKLEGPDGRTTMLPTVSSAEAQKTVVVQVTPQKAGAYKIVVLGLTEQASDLGRAPVLANLNFDVELDK